MSETILIQCDRCGLRVGQAERTRIRFGREPERRDPADLCSTCRDDLCEFLDRRGPSVTAPTPRARVRA